MSVLQFLPRFRKLDECLHQFEEREGWTRGDIESYQIDRLNRVWIHARKHVPYYKDLASSLDLPERFESIAHFISAVPVLSKDDVRQSPKRFLSMQPQPGSAASAGVIASNRWLNRHAD